MTGVSNKADIPSLNKKLDHRTDAHTQVAIKARMTAFGCKEQSIGRGPSDAAHRAQACGAEKALLSLTATFRFAPCQSHVNLGLALEVVSS
jgi:hypothetical protein